MRALSVETEIADVWATSFAFSDGSDCPYTESGSGSWESDDLWFEYGTDDTLCALGLEIAFPEPVGGGTDDWVSKEYFGLKSDVA